MATYVCLNKFGFFNSPVAMLLRGLLRGLLPMGQVCRLGRLVLYLLLRLEWLLVVVQRGRRQPHLLERGAATALD